MNFAINANYRQAVENFNWDVQESASFIEEKSLEQLVNQVAQSIISANQIKPMLEEKASRSLSLLEACYVVVQAQDQKNPAIISRIQQASENEKQVLNLTFKKLAEAFEQIEPLNLKAMTLLFGANRVHELVKAKMAQAPEASPTEQMEAVLVKLKAMRAQYNAAALSSDLQKQMLAKIDQEIEKHEALLNARKQPLSS